MKKNLNLALCCIFTLCLSPLSQAEVLTSYLAKMDVSKWYMGETSPFICELKHDIPKFGVATFFQESGRPLKLRLKSRYRFKESTEVSFRSVSAAWKTPKTEVNIATIVIDKGEDFTIGEPHARQAFFELQDGNFPSFFFFSGHNNSNTIAVALSTVRFKNKIDEFQECVAGLYPDNFHDVNVAHIYFDFDEEFPIEGKDEGALKDMLAYMRADPRVTRFMVTGHTDDRGKICYNDTLSERRALYVYDLVSASIGKQRIDYQFVGESQPIDKRKNEKAWAKNRRVKVEMFKD